MSASTKDTTGAKDPAEEKDTGTKDTGTDDTRAEDTGTTDTGTTETAGTDDAKGAKKAARATRKRAGKRTVKGAGTDTAEETAERGTDAAATSEDRPRTGRPPAMVPLAVLVCAILVAAAGCLALWHEDSRDHAIERARQEALAAAQSDAKDLLSYNYRTLDYDLKKAKSEMTPGMAKSYAEYWRIFRPSVEKSKTQALTQIQVAGVAQATPDTAEILLFVKMISVNAAHKEPQVDSSWPRLRMKKVGKKWLIDGPRMTSPPPASAGPSSTPAPSGKAPSKGAGKTGKTGRTSGKNSAKKH